MYYGVQTPDTPVVPRPLDSLWFITGPIKLLQLLELGEGQAEGGTGG